MMNTLLTCFSFTMQLKINRICPRLNNQFVLTSACETRSSLMRGFRKRIARRTGQRMGENRIKNDEEKRLYVTFSFSLYICARRE